MLADRLDAEHAMIRLATRDPDEAAVLARLHGQGPADGGEGEDAWITIVRRLILGPRPTLTISGSVKQTAAMATGSKRRSWPAMISATTSPWAEPLWASMGSPVRSPIAQTFFIEVAQRSSIFTNGPSMATPSPPVPSPWSRASPDGDEDSLSAGA
jgi:hypothetical protein